eukprot:1085869_1
MTEPEDVHTFRPLTNINMIHLLRLLSTAPISNSLMMCTKRTRILKDGCTLTMIPMSTTFCGKQYKQSTNWRTQADNIYTDLDEIEYKNRPKQAISQLRTNKLHSKEIKQDQIKIMDQKELVFTVTRNVRKEPRTYTVNILDGFCSCYSFVQNKVPCVDMYAVFTHVNMGCDVPFSLLP